MALLLLLCSLNIGGVDDVQTGLQLLRVSVHRTDDFVVFFLTYLPAGRKIDDSKRHKPITAWTNLLLATNGILNLCDFRGHKCLEFLVSLGSRGYRNIQAVFNGLVSLFASVLSQGWSHKG
jgi:hypothetical protein